MEIWGRCAECSRWFYCPTAEGGGEWACPVCASEPIAIENRAQRPVVARIDRSELEATGTAS
jgi:hypothetical protein